MVFSINAHLCVAMAILYAQISVMSTRKYAQTFVFLIVQHA
nr:MAG TPA: hypothetical protein [Caudoviricetes sp.]